MKKNIYIYPSSEKLAKHFAEILFNKISLLCQNKNRISLVLSGGNTPKLIYKIFAEYYAQKIKWEFIHLFWGDERCVPPDNPESNYRMGKDNLLNFVSIPEDNIHKIKGENNPQVEAERYSAEILSNTQLKGGLPSFDIILLGLGEDGHTASIFPKQEYLLTSEKICAATFHPVTKQKRITITGRVINNSDNISFLVTGTPKAEIIKKIIDEKEDANLFPAYYIHSTNGDTNWYLDKDAAIYLANKK